MDIPYLKTKDRRKYSFEFLPFLFTLSNFIRISMPKLYEAVLWMKLKILRFNNEKECMRVTLQKYERKISNGKYQLCKLNMK